MKGWIALLLTAALLCQLEPVYAVLHQNLPWLPETPPIELPRFYLIRRTQSGPGRKTMAIPGRRRISR